MISGPQQFTAMYSHSPSVDIPHQIDVVPGSGEDNDPSGAPDCMGQQSHIGYDDGSVAATGIMVDDMSPDSVYASACGGPGSEFGFQGGDISNQLTLTFRGQVYVFDDITPDRVQAVLLLLGGCEVNSGLYGMDGAPQSQRDPVMEYPGRSTQPHREASLNRFRQKRKERCFDKKVRYGVRQQVAQRMHRKKGQFTSAKQPDGTDGGDGSQDSGHDDSQQEIYCTHCGISSKLTPMMRRGPSGPRSLCNACGLFYANKGVLRDLSKKNQDHGTVPVEQIQAEGEANVSVAGMHNTENEQVVYSNNGEGESGGVMCAQIQSLDG